MMHALPDEPRIMIATGAAAELKDLHHAQTCPWCDIHSAFGCNALFEVAMAA